MKKRWVLLGLILFSNLTIAAENTNSVFQQYHDGQYNESKETLKLLSEKNNAEATFYLANMYLYGYAVKRNTEQGIALMTRAGDLNYLPAELYLGGYYLKDKKNIETAANWFLKAANQGNLHAEMFTALAYLYGYGLKQNSDKARKYLIDCAKSGIPMAQYELGKLFSESRHAADKKMGAIWISMASKNNYLPQNATLSQEPLQNMQQLLAQAKINLENPEVVSAANNELTSTPKMISVNKENVIQPNYRLISPNEIPLDKVLSFMLKLSYKNKKAELFLPTYRFSLPEGANNLETALPLLIHEADYGVPKAAFRLGQIYDQGLSVPKDPQKAFTYFKEAADQNYLKAEYMFGIYYLLGKSGQQNMDEAIAWLSKAALRGSHQAQFVLGNIYEYGVGEEGAKNYLPSDFEIAKSMYTLACEGQLGVAEYRLAELYGSGLLNQDNNVVLEHDQIKKAFHFYELAVEYGISKAQVPLAYFYALQKNATLQKKAFEIAKNQAQNGNQLAVFLLAVLYDRGIGVAKNEKEAINLYQQLNNHNNTFAAFMLGTHDYLNNNKNEAINLLQQAAQSNNVYAQYNLAMITREKSPMNADDAFINLLTQAAEHHFNRAYLLIADHYLLNAALNKTAEAAKIYETLAKNQDPTAELKLGFMYEHGILYPQNEQKALYWYQKAAQHYQPIAQFLLARMYQLGKGIPRDVDKAIHFYKEAANQEYIPAIVALGFVYEMNKHNYEKAKLWYLKAANTSPEAKYNLGLMYQYGKGVTVDNRKAGQFLKEAKLNEKFAAHIASPG